MSALDKIAAAKGLDLAPPEARVLRADVICPPRGRHAGDFNPYKQSVEDLCEAGLVTPDPGLYFARAVCRKDFASGEYDAIVAPPDGKEDDAHGAYWYEIREVGSGIPDPWNVGDWVSFVSAGADPIAPDAPSPMWVKVDPADVIGSITLESRRRWLEGQEAQ